MEKLVLTAWIGQTVRNLLFGSAISELRKTFDVIVVSPYSKELQAIDFKNNHGGEICFERLKVPRWRLPQAQGWLITILYRWGIYSLWQVHQPISPKKWITKWRKDNLARHYLDCLGGAFITYLRSNVGDDHDWIRDIVYLSPLRGQFASAKVFLFSTTDLPKDQALAYSCKRLGIPFVILVHSWDILPARGVLPARPNRLMVWNHFMKEDATTIHKIPRECIDIVGVPQYETYRRLSHCVDEGSFRDRLQIPHRASVLTYTCSAEWVVPDEYDLISVLLEAIQDDRFGEAVLVIRLLPGGSRNKKYADQFAGTNLPIRLDHPDDSFAAMDAGSVGSRESMMKFVELMKFSNIVVNVASTITLDAILFDRPIICPKFGFHDRQKDWNSVNNVYGSSHFQRVIDFNAVSLPTDVAQLYEDIVVSIENPSLRSEERKILAKQMMPDVPTGRLIKESVRRAALTR
jgi:hypothetical protein